jgi:hypothetical protein
MRKQPPHQHTDERRKPSPTVLLEVPLRVTASQARQLRAHLEAARQLYNAILSEGQQRLRRMQADPGEPAARNIPRTQKLERHRAYGTQRRHYAFSGYALHKADKGGNCTWIADHVDAVLAQWLSTRAYRALNQVGRGQAQRVCFHSRSQVLSSVENKRNATGLRFVHQQPEGGDTRYLLWWDDRLPALIDWNDQVVTYGLCHPSKYARLNVRQDSSARAQGTDLLGLCNIVLLVLEGVPYQKPKHLVGGDTMGIELGLSTLAIVPREGEARLEVLCAKLPPETVAICCLERKLDRQRRANNPDNCDAHGRIKKRGKRSHAWKQSKRYQATRRRKATRECTLAAHRKSLHGRLVHEIVAGGKTVLTEKISYRARPQQFGRSVGLRAPGMFMELLRRTIASTGGTLAEVSTRSTKLSQFCHGCGQYVPKPLWQRWRKSPCGISAQRDLYSAFLAAYLDPADLLPLCARCQGYWEGRESGLQAAYEQAVQRASAGHSLLCSFGIPGESVRLPKSPCGLIQEPRSAAGAAERGNRAGTLGTSRDLARRGLR